MFSACGEADGNSCNTSFCRSIHQQPNVNLKLLPEGSSCRTSYWEEQPVQDSKCVPTALRGACELEAAIMGSSAAPSVQQDELLHHYVVATSVRQTKAGDQSEEWAVEPEASACSELDSRPGLRRSDNPQPQPKSGTRHSRQVGADSIPEGPAGRRSGRRDRPGRGAKERVDRRRVHSPARRYLGPAQLSGP